MDETTTPEVVEEAAPEVEAEPYESESSRYIRVRAEAKAQAKVTMEKEAKAAEKRKREARRAGATIPGLDDFNKRAKEVERQINADTTDEAKPKGK